VILLDRNLCLSGSDVCSSGCEKFQGSRVFVDVELNVLTSNWKNQIHVGSDHFRRTTYGILLMMLMSQDDCSYMYEDVQRICSLSLCVYNCNNTL
jgi:hypothetical protein